jgi:regulator of protease activity HflC (stomatin/prohibitin superfamily)
MAGLNVVSALVTDMAVDPAVLKAMNEINASRRQREAAVERAEAEKILRVKAAEAEAEAKELSGKGTARMRQAITEGFKGSIQSMQDA